MHASAFYNHSSAVLSSSANRRFAHDPYAPVVLPPQVQPEGPTAMGGYLFNGTSFHIPNDLGKNAILAMPEPARPLQLLSPQSLRQPFYDHSVSSIPACFPGEECPSKASSMHSASYRSQQQAPNMASSTRSAYIASSHPFDDNSTVGSVDAPFRLPTPDDKSLDIDEPEEESLRTSVAQQEEEQARDELPMMPAAALCRQTGLSFKLAAVQFRFTTQWFIAPFRILVGESVIVQNKGDTEHLGVVTVIQHPAQCQLPELPTLRIIRRANDDDRVQFQSLRQDEQQWCKTARLALKGKVPIRYEFRSAEVHPHECALTFVMSFDNLKEGHAFKHSIERSLGIELRRPITVLVSDVLMRPKKNYKRIIPDSDDEHSTVSSAPPAPSLGSTTPEDQPSDEDASH